MNITDIDDKIIVRGRQTHLLTKYKSENTIITENVYSFAEDLWRKFVESIGIESKGPIESVLAALEKRNSQEIPDENSKWVLHYEIAKKGGESILKSSIGNPSEGLLDGIGDILSKHLDSIHGSAITDAKIFKDMTIYWEKEYFKDMDALGISRPDVLTRVTEYVPEIIQYVQKIIDNGFAYISNGSVYFDRNAFEKAGHVYAQLCPSAAHNTKLVEEGEGSLSSGKSEKKSPFDFALWKASKPGEPFWSSPWSNGRPGWHIECSAMACDVLGQSIDIHSGGIDLAFPHHDNEIAQAEGYYAKDGWVANFLHAGHLHIEGLKMSKSLKNFITIQEALKKYTPRQIRILFLMHTWNATMDYKETSMEGALAVEKTLVNFFANIDALIRQNKDNFGENHSFREDEKALMEYLFNIQNKVHSALLDSFDTPLALQCLLDLINKTNIYISKGSISPYPLTKISAFVTKILTAFGLIQKDSIGFSSAVQTDSKLMPVLEILSEFRDSIRELARAKAPHVEMLKLCDKLRDISLPTHGIVLEDRENLPSLVKLMDEVSLSRSNSLNGKVEKKANSLQEERERLAAEKAEKAKIPPSELFKSDLSYTQFDEFGVPTHDGIGELTKSKRKKLLKEYELHVALFEKYNKK